MTINDSSTNNIANIKLSVKEISHSIKLLLENNFNSVQIRGELSGLKVAQSGHAYFNLKEQDAVIAATCWRPSLNKITFKLQDGIEVLATGKITSYAGQSKYQISVSHLEPYGEGAFMQILRQRRQLLAQEGLFAAEHKLTKPFLPKSIGVITSASGAVIQDIIHRITERFPLHLMLWPVSVQGDNCAAEVASAIKGFNNLLAKPDIIIIARGGGSIEDLWGFNEEIVVRAAFDSKIFIISAVGHETDYTLLDLVADLRAPTPSAAAEIAVPVLKNLTYTLNVFQRQLVNKAMAMHKYYQQQLANRQQYLVRINYLVNSCQQKLDEQEFRMQNLLSNFVNRKQLILKSITSYELKPQRLIEYKALQLNNLFRHLDQSTKQLLDRCQTQLSNNNALLQSLDYKQVLKRGYTIIANNRGKAISSAKQLSEGQIVEAVMHDGRRKMSVT